MVTIARQGPYELVYDGDKDGLSWGHVKEGSRHLMPPRPLATLLSHGDWEPVDGGLSAAAVRRVRTPEGERRYGQPIGTIIKRDAAERTVKALIPDAPEFEHAWVSNEDAIREISDVVRKTVSDVFGDELTSIGTSDSYPDGLSIYDRSDAASGFFGLDIRSAYLSHNAGGLLIRIRRKIRLIEGIVHNDYFVVDPAHQDHGLAEALTKNLRDLYIRRGIQRVTVGANIDVGGYAWAKRGFDWPLGTAYDYLRTMKTEDPDLLFQIDKLIERENTGKHVTPVEIAMLGYEKRWTERDTLTGEKREMWFGKEFMLGSSWAGIMRLYPDGADPRIEAMSEEEWARLLSGVLESEGLGPDEVDLPGMIKDIKDKVAEGVTLEQMVSADLFRDEILPKHTKDVPDADERPGGGGVQQMLGLPEWREELLPALERSTEGGNLLYQILNELRVTGQRFPGFRASVFRLDSGTWDLGIRSDNLPDGVSIMVIPNEMDPKRMSVQIRLSEPFTGRVSTRPAPPATVREATETLLAVVEGFGAWLVRMQDAGWQKVDLTYGYRLPDGESPPGDPSAFRRIAGLMGMDVQQGTLPEILHVTIPPRSGTYRNWQLVEEGDRVHILPPPGVEGREDWWAPSMQSAREMIDLLNLLAPMTSAAVRRVRTPEGAEKYGQPIGSVIKRDSAPIKARIPEVVRWETERQAHAAIVNEVAAVVAEVFGPGVRVRSTTDVDDDFVDLMITGSDRDGLPVEGAIARQIAFYWTTSPPKIMIDNVAFSLNGEQQGKGFGSKVTKALTALYQRSGVVAVRVYANADVGGYAWAKQGFDFQDRTDGLRFRRWLLNLAAQKTAVVRKGEPDWEMWMRVRRDLEPVSDDPTPLELAMAGYAPGLETWPGKEFMLGRSWSGIMYLGWAEAETAAGVRRVRTPEGVAKYGQPIGTIITRDKVVKAYLTPKPKVRGSDLKVGGRYVRADGEVVEVLSANISPDEVEILTVDLSGPKKGSVNWDYPQPDAEYEAIEIPDDPFLADVIQPVHEALAELHWKYPDGVEKALWDAMTTDDPEPVFSPELRRLSDLDNVRTWLYRDLPAAEAEMRKVQEEYDAFMLGEYTVPEGLTKEQAHDWWRREKDEIWVRHSAARRRLAALIPGNMGGDYLAYDTLLKEHQKEYRRWQTLRNRLRPEAPEAVRVMRDVMAVGAIANTVLKIETARLQRQKQGMTLTKAERQAARRLVAALQGTATSTKQTWLGDLDITEPGEMRNLNDAEKDMLTEALLLFPKDWVTALDTKTPLITTSKSVRGYFREARRPSQASHLSLSGEGISEGEEMFTIAVHEVGHAMEKVVRGLPELETIFWWYRVGSDRTMVEYDSYRVPSAPERPTALQYTLKYYGDATFIDDSGAATPPGPDGMAMPIPDRSRLTKSWEIFTTGVQEVLGDGSRKYTSGITEGAVRGGTLDNDLRELTLGALLSLRPMVQ